MNAINLIFYFVTLCIIKVYTTLIMLDFNKERKEEESCIFIIKISLNLVPKPKCDCM